MPVSVKHEVRRLTQHEFSDVAYGVMGKLFDIHEDLGRLFDEEIYQRELLQRLPEARGEAPLQVTFDSFSKTYFLDVVYRGGILELKVVESLAPRHRAIAQLPLVDRFRTRQACELAAGASPA